MTRPLRMIDVLMASRSPAKIKNGHAHGEAVGDLFENHALRAVGDIAVDLDAAIDRAGMHDQAVRLEAARAFLGQAKQSGCIRQARENILCAGVRAGCEEG